MLKSMIEEHLGEIRPGKPERPTMDSIAETFRRKRAEIENSSVDEETRQSMLASLGMQEREAIRQAMEVDV